MAWSPEQDWLFQDLVYNAYANCPAPFKTVQEPFKLSTLVWEVSTQQKINFYFSEFPQNQFLKNFQTFSKISRKFSAPAQF